MCHTIRAPGAVRSYNREAYEMKKHPLFRLANSHSGSEPTLEYQHACVASFRQRLTPFTTASSSIVAPSDMGTCSPGNALSESRRPLSGSEKPDYGRLCLVQWHEEGVSTERRHTAF